MVTDRFGAVTGAALSGPAFRVAVETITREQLHARLPVGSTLTARVLEVTGRGQYIVGVAGMKLVAESGLDLPPGAKVGVQVASHTPKIHLRILKPDDAGMERVLRQLGYDKATPALRAVVTELMEQGQPLTRENVRRAEDGIAKALTPRAAVALVRHEIPLTPATHSRALAADGSVAQTLDRLSSALTALGRGAEADRIRGSLTFSGDLGDLFSNHPLKFERRLLGGEVRADRAEVKPMLEMIARATTPDSGPEREAAVAARQLIDTMEGRYLVGTPERQIPFVIEDDGSRDASLTAERNGGRTNIKIQLETSRLGVVVGMVDSVNRGVGIALGVDTSEARKALMAAAPQLTTRLHALGFRLDGMTIDVLDPQARLRAAGSAPVARPALGVDLKA